MSAGIRMRGVKKLEAEITGTGLAPAGSASTVHHAVDRAEIRDRH